MRTVNIQKSWSMFGCLIQSIPEEQNMYFFVKSNTSRNCTLNFHDQKIRRTPTGDIRKHWTAVSTLLGLTWP